MSKVRGPDIAVEALSFSWGNKPVYQGFSLRLRGGKSTLLRLVAGLSKPQQGSIRSERRAI
ncbi:hypothetical protein [Candidatus Pantoea persica]|uniref:hypothetical protein n=1 Tax=Candidatus Pantoea persica TaxID=2518128 RepID=UPI00215D9B83|nr:hypothetical protein [Candidatus Pantoea persica]MBA2814025.1 ABC transporter ATPase [Candidatus Pantoea persica]